MAWLHCRSVRTCRVLTSDSYPLSPTANQFKWHADDGDFTISTVSMPTKDDAPFGAGVSCSIALTGTVKNASAILAGNLQYKIYESYVQHFTQEGNTAYFSCDNKGCDRDSPVGLDLALPMATTPSDFTANLPFVMPVAQKTGQFRMVVWGSNQNHFPYDFSLELGFNYSKSAGLVITSVQPTTGSNNTYKPAKITWAASGGNMSVAEFEVKTMNGAFVAGESAHVNQTGVLDKALTAGAVQWQIFEQGVRSFIESGNSNYFRCTNKGCDILSPVALTLHKTTVPADYQLNFAFNIPTPEATGEFTLVAWGTDQDHFPYDFSISAHFKVPMSA